MQLLRIPVGCEVDEREEVRFTGCLGGHLGSRARVCSRIRAGYSLAYGTMFARAFAFKWSVRGDELGAAA